MNKENICKNEILKSEKIQRFLRNHGNENTKPRYEYHISQFFNFINKDPETYLNNEYEFLPLEEKKKLSSMYKRDIEDFKYYLTSNNNKYNRDFKPATIRTILSVIKSLFTYTDIDLPEGYWKRTNNFKNSRTSIADTPTPEQLRKIFDNTDLQGKCIFGIMKDSGSRINSVVLLKRSDIDINREYPIINFYYKNVKNGITKKKRVTPETKHFLQTYFEKYIFKPDDRIFPMTRQNASYKWNCAIEKTKLSKIDLNTNRLTMTTHCLKRFFKTYTANIDKALCDYFCEHGNLNDTYYNAPDDKLDREYSKIVNNLLVYEKPYDTDIRVKQIQKELDESKGSNKIIKEKLTTVENKSETYENRLKKIEENLHISTNPNTPQTQNTLNYFKPIMINFVENLTGKKLTNEQLEEINTGTKFVLNELNKLPADEISNLVKPENLPNLYDQLKKKKQIK